MYIKQILSVKHRTKEQISMKKLPSFLKDFIFLRKKKELLPRPRIRNSLFDNPLLSLYFTSYRLGIDGCIIKNKRQFENNE